DNGDKVWFRQKSQGQNGKLIDKPLDWKEYLFGMGRNPQTSNIEGGVLLHMFEAPKSGLYMGPLLKVSMREPVQTYDMTKVLASEFKFAPVRGLVRAMGVGISEEKIATAMNYFKQHTFIKNAFVNEVVSLADVALFVESIDRVMKLPERLGAYIDGNKKAVAADNFSDYEKVSFSDTGRSNLGWAWLFFKPNYVLDRDVELLRIVHNNKSEMQSGTVVSKPLNAKEFVSEAKIIQQKDGLDKAINELSSVKEAVVPLLAQSISKTTGVSNDRVIDIAREAFYNGAAKTTIENLAQEIHNSKGFTEKPSSSDTSYILAKDSLQLAEHLRDNFIRGNTEGLQKAVAHQLWLDQGRLDGKTQENLASAKIIIEGKQIPADTGLFRIIDLDQNSQKLIPLQQSFEKMRGMGLLYLPGESGMQIIKQAGENVIKEIEFKSSISYTIKDREFKVNLPATDALFADARAAIEYKKLNSDKVFGYLRSNNQNDKKTRDGIEQMFKEEFKGVELSEDAYGQIRRMTDDIFNTYTAYKDSQEASLDKTTYGGEHQRNFFKEHSEALGLYLEGNPQESIQKFKSIRSNVIAEVGIKDAQVIKEWAKEYKSKKDVKDDSWDKIVNFYNKLDSMSQAGAGINFANAYYANFWDNLGVVKNFEEVKEKFAERDVNKNSQIIELELKDGGKIPIPNKLVESFLNIDSFKNIEKAKYIAKLAEKATSDGIIGIDQAIKELEDFASSANEKSKAASILDEKEGIQKSEIDFYLPILKFGKIIDVFSKLSARIDTNNQDKRISDPVEINESGEFKYGGTDKEIGPLVKAFNSVIKDEEIGKRWDKESFKEAFDLSDMLGSLAKGELSSFLGKFLGVSLVGYTKYGQFKAEREKPGSGIEANKIASDKTEGQIQMIGELVKDLSVALGTGKGKSIASMTELVLQGLLNAKINSKTNEKGENKYIPEYKTNLVLVVPKNSLDEKYRLYGEYAKAFDMELKVSSEDTLINKNSGEKAYQFSQKSNAITIIDTHAFGHLFHEMAMDVRNAVRNGIDVVRFDELDKTFRHDTTYITSKDKNILKEAVWNEVNEVMDKKFNGKTLRELFFSSDSTKETIENALGIKIFEPDGNNAQKSYQSVVDNKEPAIYLNRADKLYRLNDAAIKKLSGELGAKVYVFENILKAYLFIEGKDYKRDDNKISPMEESMIAEHKIFNSEYLIAALAQKEGIKDRSGLEVSTTSSQATLSEILKINAYSIAGFSGSMEDIGVMVKFGIGRGVSSLASTVLKNVRTIEVTGESRIRDVVKEIKVSDKNTLTIVNDPRILDNIVKELKDNGITPKIVYEDKDIADATKNIGDSKDGKKVFIGLGDRVGRNTDFKGDFNVFVADPEKSTLSDIRQFLGRLRGDNGERVLFVDSDKLGVFTDKTKKAISAGENVKKEGNIISISGKEVFKTKGSDNLAMKLVENAFELNSAEKSRATLSQIYERGFSTVDSFLKDLLITIDKVKQLASSRGIDLSNEQKELQSVYEHLIRSKETNSYDALRIAENMQDPLDRIRSVFGSLDSDISSSLAAGKEIVNRMKDKLAGSEKGKNNLEEVSHSQMYQALLFGINEIDRHITAVNNIRADGFDQIYNKIAADKTGEVFKNTPRVSRTKETLKDVLENAALTNMIENILPEEIANSKLTQYSPQVTAIIKEVNEAKAREQQTPLTLKETNQIVKGLNDLISANGIRGSPHKATQLLKTILGYIPGSSPSSINAPVVEALKTILSQIPNQHNPIISINQWQIILEAVNNLIDLNILTADSGNPAINAPFKLEHKQQLADTLVMLVDPNVSYSVLSGAMEIYKDLPKEYQNALGEPKNSNHFNDLLTQPQDFFASLIHIGNDQYRSNLRHLDFLKENKDFVLLKDKFSGYAAKIAPIQGIYIKHLLALEQTKEAMEKMDLIRLLSINIKATLKGISPFIMYNLARIAILEDKDVRDKLYKIQEKTQELDAKEKDFLSSLANFNSYLQFAENILAGEDVFQSKILTRPIEQALPDLISAHRMNGSIDQTALEQKVLELKDSLKELSTSLVDDVNISKADVIISKITQTLFIKAIAGQNPASNIKEKIKNAIDIAKTDKELQDLINTFEELTGLNFKSDQDKVAQLTGIISELKSIQKSINNNQSKSESDFIEAIQKTKAEIVRVLNEKYGQEDTPTKKEIRKIIYEKYIGSYYSINQAIKSISARIQENPDLSKEARNIINKMRENWDNAVNGREITDIKVASSGLQKMIRSLLALDTTLTVAGQQGSIKEGEFYTPWHRAEMLRRVSQGYFDIPDELFELWLNQTPTKKLFEDMFGENGEVGKVIFDRIDDKIFKTLEQRFTEDKDTKQEIKDKVKEITVSLKEAKTLKELMDSALALKGGTGKLYIRFCLPEEMEKQALVSNTDYGMADIKSEGKDLVISLDIRLLQPEENNRILNWQNSEWRGDLKHVVLSHEITHVILDAVAHKAGINDLKIGNQANEEYVDAITSHDGLGKLKSYTRVPFSGPSLTTIAVEEPVTPVQKQSPDTRIEPVVEGDQATQLEVKEYLQSEKIKFGDIKATIEKELEYVTTGLTIEAINQKQEELIKKIEDSGLSQEEQQVLKSVIENDIKEVIADKEIENKASAVQEREEKEINAIARIAQALVSVKNKVLDGVTQYIGKAKPKSSIQEAFSVDKEIGDLSAVNIGDIPGPKISSSAIEKQTQQSSSPVFNINSLLILLKSDSKDVYEGIAGQAVAPDFKRLFEDTIYNIYGDKINLDEFNIEFSRADHFDVGKFKTVYVARVYSRDSEELLYKFVLKVPKSSGNEFRASESADPLLNEYEGMGQITDKFNGLTQERAVPILGNIINAGGFNFLTQEWIDARGNTYEDLLQKARNDEVTPEVISKASQEVLALSLAIWSKMDGRFIDDPHPNNFVFYGAQQSGIVGKPVLIDVDNLQEIDKNQLLMTMRSYIFNIRDLDYLRGDLLSRLGDQDSADRLYNSFAPILEKFVEANNNPALKQHSRQKVTEAKNIYLQKLLNKTASVTSSPISQKIARLIIIPVMVMGLSLFAPSFGNAFEGIKMSGFSAAESATINKASGEINERFPELLQLARKLGIEIVDIKGHNLKFSAGQLDGDKLKLFDGNWQLRKDLTGFISHELGHALYNELNRLSAGGLEKELKAIEKRYGVDEETTGVDREQRKFMVVFGGVDGVYGGSYKFMNEYPTPYSSVQGELVPELALLKVENTLSKQEVRPLVKELNDALERYMREYKDKLLSSSSPLGLRLPLDENIQPKIIAKAASSAINGGDNDRKVPIETSVLVNSEGTLAIFKEVLAKEWKATKSLVNGYSNVAVFILGSTSRRELVPGSDVDYWVIPIDKNSEKFARILDNRLKNNQKIRTAAIDLSSYSQALNFPSAEELSGKLDNRGKLENFVALLDMVPIYGDKETAEKINEIISNIINEKGSYLTKRLDESINNLQKNFTLPKTGQRAIQYLAWNIRLKLGINSRNIIGILREAVNHNILNEAEASRLIDLYRSLFSLRVSNNLGFGGPRYQVSQEFLGNYSQVIALIQDINGRLPIQSGLPIDGRQPLRNSPALPLSPGSSSPIMPALFGAAVNTNTANSPVIIPAILGLKTGQLQVGIGLSTEAGLKILGAALRTLSPGVRYTPTISSIVWRGYEEARKIALQFGALVVAVTKAVKAIANEIEAMAGWRSATSEGVKERVIGESVTSTRKAHEPSKDNIGNKAALPVKKELAGKPGSRSVTPQTALNGQDAEGASSKVNEWPKQAVQVLGAVVMTGSSAVRVAGSETAITGGSEVVTSETARNMSSGRFVSNNPAKNSSSPIYTEEESIRLIVKSFEQLARLQVNRSRREGGDGITNGPGATKGEFIAGRKDLIDNIGLIMSMDKIVIEGIMNSDILDILMEKLNQWLLSTPQADRSVEIDKILVSLDKKEINRMLQEGINITIEFLKALYMKTQIFNEEIGFFAKLKYERPNEANEILKIFREIRSARVAILTEEIPALKKTQDEMGAKQDAVKEEVGAVKESEALKKQSQGIEEQGQMITSLEDRLFKIRKELKSSSPITSEEEKGALNSSLSLGDNINKLEQGLERISSLQSGLAESREDLIKRVNNLKDRIDKHLADIDEQFSELETIQQECNQKAIEINERVEILRGERESQVSKLEEIRKGYERIEKTVGDVSTNYLVDSKVYERLRKEDEQRTSEIISRINQLEEERRVQAHTLEEIGKAHGVKHQEYERRSRMAQEELAKARKELNTALSGGTISNLNTAKLENANIIPQIEIVVTPTNKKYLEGILKDVELAENILLVGDAGVGKDSLILYLAKQQNMPCQIMSLSEETEVRDLLVRQTFGEKEAGRTEWQDSILVDSMRKGYWVVLDEVDKVSAGVLASLNNLLQFKDVTLPNRELIKANSGFRVFATMNPPRPPYTGNLLSGELEDRFSVHYIDYLPKDEEILILKSHAPNVVENLLKNLLQAATDLRTSYKNGLLPRPLSTRALIRIVRHLQKYPDDEIISVAQKAYNLEYLNDDTQIVITKALEVYGLKGKQQTRTSSPVFINNSKAANQKLSDQPVVSQRLVRILEGLARVVTGEPRVHMRQWEQIGPYDEYTWRFIFDLYQIQYVPEDLINPDEDISYGLTMHELWHLILSDPEVVDEELRVNRSFWTLLNSIEDPRVNNLGVQRYTGADPWIQKLYQEKFGFDDTKIKEEIGKRQLTPLHLQFCVGLIYKWWKGENDPRIINAKVKQALSKCDKDIQAAYSTPGAEESFRIIKDRIWPVYQDLIKQSREELRNLIKNKGKDGNSGNRESNGQLSDDVKEQLKDIRKQLRWKFGKKKRDLTEGKINEVIKQAEEEFNKKVKGKMLPEDSKEGMISQDKKYQEEFRKGIEKLKAGKQQGQVELLKELAKMGIAVQTFLENEMLRREGISSVQKESYENYLKAVRPYIATLKNHLLMIFKEITRKKMLTGRIYGNLDSGRLYQIPLGETRLFERKLKPGKFNYRICLLIDESGSMKYYDKYKRAIEGVVLFQEALKIIPGIEFEIAGFNSNPHNFHKSFKEKLTKRKAVEVVEQIQSEIGGNTEDKQAIEGSIKRMQSDSSKSKKLILVVTDGNPSKTKGQQITDLAELFKEAKDIKIFGIGIGHETKLVEEVYPYGICVEDISRLPEKISSILRKEIREPTGKDFPYSRISYPYMKPKGDRNFNSSSPVYTTEELRKIWDNLWKLKAQLLYRVRHELEPLLEEYHKGAYRLLKESDYSDEVAWQEADAFAARSHIKSQLIVKMRRFENNLDNVVINDKLLDEFINNEFSNGSLKGMDSNVIKNKLNMGLDSLASLLIMNEELSLTFEELKKREKDIEEVIMQNIERIRAGEIFNLKERMDNLLKQGKEHGETLEKQGETLEKLVRDLSPGGALRESIVRESILETGKHIDGRELKCVEGFVPEQIRDEFITKISSKTRRLITIIKTLNPLLRKIGQPVVMVFAISIDKFVNLAKERLVVMDVLERINKDMLHYVRVVKIHELEGYVEVIDSNDGGKLTRNVKIKDLVTTRDGKIVVIASEKYYLDLGRIFEDNEVLSDEEIDNITGEVYGTGAGVGGGTTAPGGPSGDAGPGDSGTGSGPLGGDGNGRMPPDRSNLFGTLGVNSTNSPATIGDYNNIVNNGIQSGYNVNGNNEIVNMANYGASSSLAPPSVSSSVASSASSPIKSNKTFLVAILLIGSLMLVPTEAIGAKLLHKYQTVGKEVAPIVEIWTARNPSANTISGIAKDINAAEAKAGHSENIQPIYGKNGRVERIAKDNNINDPNLIHSKQNIFLQGLSQEAVKQLLDKETTISGGDKGTLVKANEKLGNVKQPGVRVPLTGHQNKNLGQIAVALLIGAILLWGFWPQLKKLWNKHKETAARKAAQETSHFYFDNDGNINIGGLKNPPEEHGKTFGQSIRAERIAVREAAAKKTTIIPTEEYQEIPEGHPPFEPGFDYRVNMQTGKKEVRISPKDRVAGAKEKEGQSPESKDQAGQSGTVPVVEAGLEEAQVKEGQTTEPGVSGEGQAEVKSVGGAETKVAESEKQLSVEENIKEAKTALERGEDDKVIQFLLKADELDPSFAEIQYLLFGVYKKQGKHSKAADAWAEYERLRFEKNGIEATKETERKLSAIEVLWENGETDKAVRLSKEIVRSNPELFNRLSEQIRNQINPISRTSSPINTELPFVPTQTAENNSIYIVKISSSSVDNLAVVEFARELNQRDNFERASSALSTKAIENGINNYHSQAPPVASFIRFVVNLSKKEAGNESSKEFERGREKNRREEENHGSDHTAQSGISSLMDGLKDWARAIYFYSEQLITGGLRNVKRAISISDENAGSRLPKESVESYSGTGSFAGTGRPAGRVNIHVIEAVGYLKALISASKLQALVSGVMARAPPVATKAVIPSVIILS
ncbi:MAG: AAA family ATPase, partial [Candidatus Omnitrophica bacterium]|nr:AAA family ATPase [Candidatus Omnitrophota bacterium]